MKFVDVELRPSRTFFKDMDPLVGELRSDSLIVDLHLGLDAETGPSAKRRLTSIARAGYEVRG